MPGIVVGFDGSHHASQALEWALAEAMARKAPLTVLTIHPVQASWTGRPAEFPEDEAKIAEKRKLAEEAVAAAAEKLAAQPESVTVSAIAGFPAKALIDAGKDSDLLVVGRRGGGGFAALALGSVSNQITHHALCPVVVVPSAS